MTKNKLEEILTLSGEQFKIGAMNDNKGLIQFEFVFNITIIYNNTIKEDLFIGLTQIVSAIEGSMGIIYGIETNISSIPNFIATISRTEYFKKTTGRPLIYFFEIDSQYGQGILKNENESIISNMHYKYNFRIQPYDINQTIPIDIYAMGINTINLFYPKKLDFTLEESLIIRYIASYNKLKIKLKPSLPDLECVDLNGMKKCTVSLFDFVGEKSGNYETYYSIYGNKYRIYFKLPTINIILPENRVYIIIEEKLNFTGINIGENGLLYFETNYIDDKDFFDESDIEETIFNTSIIANDNYDYIITCRLWKPSDKKLRVFCKLNDQLFYFNSDIYLKNSSFIYKDKIISIICKTRNIKYKKTDNRIPFLYSDKQNINIEKEKESYDLTFKIWEYYNETLYLQINKPDFGYKYITLDNCTVENKDLKCKVPKEKFEEVLYNDTQIISLYFYDYNLLQLKFDQVLDIVVNNNQNIKENIYIDLTKIKEDQINKMNLITYETNVTSIHDVFSDTFSLGFNYMSGMGITQEKCFFKKMSEQPFFLHCLMTKEGSFSLFQNDKIQILDNINIKYNFIILPIKNQLNFNVQNYGSYFFFEYPHTLVFHKEEELIIDYHFLGRNGTSIGIKLNPDSNASKCVDKYLNDINIKRCNIKMNHFDGKKSGYYNTYYINNTNNYSLVYSLSPIKVSLPKENDIILRIKKENNMESVRIGQKGVITFIINYNDTKNLFKDINSNNCITFKSKIIDLNKKEFDVNCKIWKPKDRNITIICNLNKNMENNRNSIILDDTILSYKDFTIYIYQDDFIDVIQNFYHIPFLYYDEQIINIDNKNSYELKFKLGSYNNDVLYIYGESNNYAILDNCKINGNDLICNISKDKLEEILILSGEQFRVGTMNDDIGLFQFEFVFNITIIYNNVIKEDLFIGLTQIINGITERGIPVGVETNITSIPNFIATINRTEYFKKTTGRPLILFYNYLYGTEETFKINIKKEEIFNDVHYKYNFRIQPCEISQDISIKERGSYINLFYPEELDFSSEDSLIIRYITSYSSYYSDYNNIKLNPDSPDIECIHLQGMEKCNISLSHFIGKKSGYFNIYHLNHQGSLSINYETNKINVKLPKEDYIEIYVNDENNSRLINIGQNRLIYFITNFTDNENFFDVSDIEEKTTFQTKIVDKSNTNYKVTCRLWKPGDEKIRIFCQLNQELRNNYVYIKIYSSLSSYKGKKIAIISEMDFKTSIYQSNSKVPFLYSGKQIVDLGDGKNIYEIKFKIADYYNEILILTSEEHEFNNIVLDKCFIEGNNLICKITKEKIMEILINSGQIFKCKFLDESYGRLSEFSNIFDIVINYNNIRKENVYIGITKLLTNDSSIYQYFTYETNVTSISNIITNKFTYQYNTLTQATCFMKKAFEKPLLLLCQIWYEGTHSLGEIKQEIRLENIHIKYNLLIQPVVNKEEFYLSSEIIIDIMLFAYPTVLDYYLNDKIKIIFYIKENNNNYIKNIKLNPDSETAIEFNVNNHIKTCPIPKSHSKNQNGYYYAYFESSFLHLYFYFYELSPIQVILPKENELIIKIRNFDNENDKIIGQKGAIAFITNYDEEILNIFNDTTIENDFAFKATFSGYDENYISDCFFWKPEGSTVIMICKFNENIISEYITLNKYSFEYNNHNITIISEDLKIKQSNSSVAFLYSNKQTVNITDNADNIIKFKKVAYNKESLILHNGFKNIILDCKEETNEIICPIKKEKIIEILSYSGEEFSLAQLTDSDGILELNFVSNISITFNDITKETININITKLLTPLVDLNNYVIYETNVTNIPKITTNSFNIAPNRNDNTNCFFKKIIIKIHYFFYVKLNLQEFPL